MWFQGLGRDRYLPHSFATIGMPDRRLLRSSSPHYHFRPKPLGEQNGFAMISCDIASRCTLRRDASSKKKTKRATADAISPEPDSGDEIVMGSDGDGLDSGDASDRGESFPGEMCGLGMAIV